MHQFHKEVSFLLTSKISFTAKYIDIYICFFNSFDHLKDLNAIFYTVTYL